MCKIIVILNKDKANIRALNIMLEANAEALAKEGDGYSVYRDGKTTPYAHKDDYHAIEKNIAYRGESIYMVHTRTKTAGESGKDGLHLQKIDKRFVFAHNGSVGKYKNIAQKSDSFYFFRNMVKAAGKHITEKFIEKTMASADFFGKGFLFDEKENKLFAFCNGYVAKIHVRALEDCIVMASFDLDEKVKRESFIDILGYVFKRDEDEEESIEFIASEEFSAGCLTFQDGILIAKTSFEEKWGAGSSYNASGRTYTAKDIEKDAYDDRHDISHLFPKSQPMLP